MGREYEGKKRIGNGCENRVCKPIFVRRQVSAVLFFMNYTLRKTAFCVIVSIT